MPNDVVAARTRPVAGGARAPVAPPEPRREVSNEDVLKAMLAMTETLRTAVHDSLSAQRGGGSASVTTEDIRAVVGAALDQPMAEIRLTVQEMRDFRDASLPAMSASINAIAGAVASQMADIQKVAQDVKDMESASFRGLRKELSEMMNHIDSTKAEIASMRPVDDKDDQIVVATSELDAVVEATEAILTTTSVSRAGPATMANLLHLDELRGPSGSDSGEVVRPKGHKSCFRNTS